jgi:hypothetical protein
MKRHLDLTTVDGLFSEALIRRLRAQVIRMEHPRHKELRWFDLAAKPRTLFEQVILGLRPQVPASDRDVGAEWWMRSQRADSGFKFHFDRDEVRADRVVSPRRSSILYLSETGGPTLIVDVGPDDDRAPVHGLAVHPRPGRFATFPGTLLHGVLPDEKSRWPRVAMFINWWTHRPEAPVQELPAGVRKISTPLRRGVRCQPPNAPREAPVPFRARDVLPDEEWLALVRCEARTLARRPAEQAAP